MKLTHINPKLLRKQTHAVVRLRTLARSDNDRQLLDGVINLLEFIQDQLDRKGG